MIDIRTRCESWDFGHKHYLHLLHTPFRSPWTQLNPVPSQEAPWIHRSCHLARFAKSGFWNLGLYEQQGLEGCILYASISYVCYIIYIYYLIYIWLYIIYIIYIYDTYCMQSTITIIMTIMMIGLQYPWERIFALPYSSVPCCCPQPRPPVNFDLLGHKVRSNLVFWISVGGDE